MMLLRLSPSIYRKQMRLGSCMQKIKREMHIGVDAFILIWNELSIGWRFLSVLAGLPIIRPILGWVYRRFASYRFARLEHCQIACKGS